MSNYTDTNDSSPLRRNISRAFSELGLDSSNNSNMFDSLKRKFMDSDGNILDTPIEGFGGGLDGQLLPRQQTLCQDTENALKQSLRLVGLLEPFSAQANLSASRALIYQITNCLKWLQKEFVQAAGPSRVQTDAYLTQLKDFTTKLGNEGHFKEAEAIGLAERQQVNNFKCLQNYGKNIKKAWGVYKSDLVTGLEDDLIKARQLMPILAADALEFKNLLLKGGLSLPEQAYARFKDINGVTTGDDATQDAKLDLTPANLITDLQRFAIEDGPNSLADNYGLDSVVKHASEFLTIVEPLKNWLTTTSNRGAETSELANALLKQEKASEACLSALHSHLYSLGKLTKSPTPTAPAGSISLPAEMPAAAAETSTAEKSTKTTSK